jgi:hypothetical protein
VLKTELMTKTAQLEGKVIELDGLHNKFDAVKRVVQERDIEIKNLQTMLNT